MDVTFFLAFLAKATNCESFGFTYQFWPRLKVLVSLATVIFIGHFGHEYQW